MKKITILLSFIIIGFSLFAQNSEVDELTIRDSVMIYNNSIEATIIDVLDNGTARLKNIATGVDGTDGINLSQLNDSLEANTFIQPLDSFLFSTDIADLSHKEGMMYFDSLHDNWILYNSESEIGLDVGMEMWTFVYNNTGSTITDGQVCVVSGNGGVVSSVILAKADLPTTINNRIGIATHDIEDGTYGYITIGGQVHGLNTSAYSISQKLYVSSTTAGDLTATKPVFPNYRVLVGYADKIDVSDGIINVGVIGTPADIIGNLASGSFNESFTFTVASNGTVITGSLVNKAGGDYLTQRYNDGVSLLDVSSPVTVTLTAGTDTNPQKQYVYMLKSTGNLTASTSYWASTQHIPIAVLYLQSATTTQTHDAIRNQNVNNHLADDTGMGGLDHMRKRIRTMPAEYEDGVGVTIVGSATTNIYPTTTSGNVWQMHLQSFPALNMSTDYGIVINDYTTANRWIANLATITTDALGGTLNNNSFSVVMWGIQNSGGEPCHLAFNFPTGTYNTSGDAIADADGYTVYSISGAYRGVGFLISRFTFSNAGGVWALESTEDLRGLNPSTIAGGGGTGGGGVTTFAGLTDTPSSYVDQANKVVTVAAAENALEYTTLSYYTPEIDNQSVVNDADNNFTIGFTLKSTTMIFYNNAYLPNALWSGEGTTTLNIGVPTKKYDYIIINKN